MKQKVLAMLLCGVLGASLLSACGSSSSSDSSESETTTEESTEETSEEDADAEETADSDGKSFEGITLVFAQDLGTDETANELTDEIIQAWEDATGGTIQFENQPSDYRTWLTTQFTAGQGPDVYSGILYDMTSDYQAGYLYNFIDLYEEESAYEEGYAWKESLPDSILERMYIDSESVPGYPSSTSVVRIFYNKTLFDEVGAEVPETWEEFIEVCQLLTDAGITAFGFPNTSYEDLSWLWFCNSLVSQLNSDIIDEIDWSGNGFIENNEICKAFDEGILDMTSEPVKEAYELMLEFSEYWTSDYNALDQSSAIDMFIRGDVAMVQAMSTNLTSISENVGDSFEYGVMPVPTITTETSEYALGTSVILGGQPDIIYGINADLEDDPEKLAAAIDFVQYMCSPDVQRQYCETINRIPLNVNIELPDSLSGFIITEEPLRLAYFTGLTTDFRDIFCRGGQEFLAGSMTVDEYAEYVQEAYASTLETIELENGWSADNDYEIEYAE